jgi:predicted O-methyltransferase YrrM
VDEELWTKVDDYLIALLAPGDRSLDNALVRSAAADLPSINVAANQGKLLELLAKMRGSRRILEIGTLGGFSTIFLARALPIDGELITLELEPAHAEVARANIEDAGLGSLVEIRIGEAADSLRDLIAEKAEPFDFIFIDADKEGYALYLSLALRLSRRGTVIVADNVIRAGAIVDAHNSDSRVEGVRQFLEMVASDERIEATAVQTVGVKGYDGFALLLVN